MQQSIKALVIYHNNCVDGFASAWAFHSLKEREYEKVDYLACNYGDFPRLDFTGLDIYILDFSFPRGILEYICHTAASVLVLDHHKTAQETLTGEWPTKPGNLRIEFDMGRSGAGMTWDYFTYAEERPDLIQYIEDRDLWKWTLDRSKEVNAYIGIAEKTFDDYDNLMIEVGSNPSMVWTAGGSLLQQLDSFHKSIIKDCKRKITINGARGLVCNCPGFFASEVGNLLACESGTYGATYFHAKDGSVKFSLRSRGDYDVSILAKLFGGGGHRNAAGFVIPPDTHELNPTAHMGIQLWKTPNDS